LVRLEADLVSAKSLYFPAFSRGFPAGIFRDEEKWC
jgi:hypothetical protein